MVDFGKEGISGNGGTWPNVAVGFSGDCAVAVAAVAAAAVPTTASVDGARADGAAGLPIPNCMSRGAEPFDAAEEYCATEKMS